MADQRADIDWREETVPVSVRFNDPYYSVADGLAEARYVFLGGNDLPSRFVPGFQIAELGFGTGLNMLAAWAAWQNAGCAGTLHFTSFEAHPLTQHDLARALAAFPDIGGLAHQFVDRWDPALERMELPGLSLRIVAGDARRTLPGWRAQADAWFLDGFAPARNPEMWEPALLNEVARHTRPGGTFATYTAAGSVRRALAAAGFDVVRQSGFGGKRHMSTGRLVQAP